MARKVKAAVELPQSTENGPAVVGLPAPQKPASSGAKTKKRRKTATALSRQSMDPLWKILDAKIGGREGMLAAAMSSANPKAQDLIPLILDKSYKTLGTKALARKVGLTGPEIVDMFRDRKWLEATLALHEDLPEVVRGATQDAKPSFTPCDNCKATGKDKEGASCYVCAGTGSLRRPGDKDKLAFVGEATGLVGKKGPAIQNNLQIVNQPQTASVSFEDLMRKAVISVNKPKQLEVVAAEVETK